MERQISRRRNRNVSDPSPFQLRRHIGRHVLVELVYSTLPYSKYVRLQYTKHRRLDGARKCVFPLHASDSYTDLVEENLSNCR